MRLILASGSPRRRELLGRLGFSLDLRPQDIDETPLPGEAPLAFARRMAEEKAEACGAWPVLAADTVVHLDGVILGKPADAREAAEGLRRLSGRWHEVTTATCLRWAGGVTRRAVTTRVRFRALGPGEIAAYVATGEPLDKAGGYGIQGLGGALVAELQGSYTNVVGLPLAEVIEDLAAVGLSIPLEDPPGAP